MAMKAVADELVEQIPDLEAKLGEKGKLIKEKGVEESGRYVSEPLMFPSLSCIDQDNPLNVDHTEDEDEESEAINNETDAVISRWLEATKNERSLYSVVEPFRLLLMS